MSQNLLARVYRRQKCPSLTILVIKKKTYPTLCYMAKKFFAVPSTSTPAERAFSCGRLLIHHTRGSMSASTIRARMCWRNWLLHNYYLKSLASLICTALAYLIISRKIRLIFVCCSALFHKRRLNGSRNSTRYQ